MTYNTPAVQQAARDLTTFFEYIPEEDWYEGAVRSRDSTKCCAIGHLSSEKDKKGKYVGKKIDPPLLAAWEILKRHDRDRGHMGLISVVSDGRDRNYKQDTPKQRVLAWLNSFLEQA